MQIIIVSLFAYGCCQARPADTGTKTTSLSRPSAGLETIVDLSVYPAMASLDEKDELTLYATLNFRVEGDRQAIVFPFAWGAYSLSSPDADLSLMAPAVSRDTAAVVVMRGVPRLSHLSVPIKGVPVAIDYRISPGEEWGYYLKGLPPGFNGPVRMRMRYSFQGTESNESDFVVNIVRTK
jgi:hypothetical protein